MKGFSSSDKIVFRKAEAADLDAITEILQGAVRKMLAEGKRQWTEEYPNRIHASADIDRGVGYVLTQGDKVVAYGAVVFDGEPVYNNLDGEWLSDLPYVVVHRLAVDTEIHGKGLGTRFFKSVENLAISQNIRSFRVDTNYDNFAMLHLLSKLGFTYCGEVVYESGFRKAFEKLL